MSQNVNPLAALNKYNIEYREQTGNDWILVKSPYAMDKDMQDPHGALHRVSGVFKCIKTDTNVPLVVYLSREVGRTVASIEKELMNLYGKSPIEDVTDAHLELWTRLLLSEDSGEYLRAMVKKGIGPEQILNYKIGLNHRGRITIPVFSADDLLLNVRCYDVLKQSKRKYTNTKDAENHALYQPNQINEDELFIAGGEIKAINLIENGFPAIAPTFGEKAWPDHLLSALKGIKKIYIVYDVDETGRKNALKLCNQLVRFNDNVYDVYLQDVSDIPGGDITDFFYTKKKSAADFRQLCERTKQFKIAIAPVVQPDTEEEVQQEVKFTRAVDAKYHQQVIKTKAVISSKDTQPYVVPKRVEVCCPRTGQEICALCPFSIGRTEDLEVEIARSDPRLLSLLDTTAAGQDATLKEVAGIPKSCKICRFESKSSFNVEVVRAIPQIAVGHSSEDAAPKTIYNVGHGIETNTEYDLVARNVCEPKTQRATLLVTGTERSRSDIDKFETEHDLRIFQPAEWTLEALETKLEDIYEDLTNNVTGIFLRNDMHIAIDLSYHSALYIPFQNKQHKGWADVLIIGDSGQGKSEASSRLLEHYKAGERVDTKRATAAGLVGGAQQTNKRWFITWGTIPLNDRRHVTLEEIKGCNEEILGKLTDMRSSGVADIQMVERSRTNARTRLLWISNARSSRQIGSYNYAVEAIKELMGSLEDVRRFDMAIAIATGEVDDDTLNGMGYDLDVPHHYTSELCNHLVMWSWSRRPENIEIEKEAQNEILHSAKRMSKKYSSAIPLVEPSDQRHKILRLATALAARTFSTDDGTTLVVRTAHVKFIEKYLCRIYDSETMGYREFSKSRFTEAVIEDDNAIRDELQSLNNNHSLVEGMLYDENVSWQTVVDYTDVDREVAHKIIGVLVRNGALKKTRRGGYRKTPAFIQLLKDMMREGALKDGEFKLVGEL